MNQQSTGRRKFLGYTALAAVMPGIPMDALALTVLQQRKEWQTFKLTPQYDSLLRAVRLMKANTNAADPKSWNYWTNVHLNYCPHGVPYFFSWHRGYLYYFERQLRTVSGDSLLVLPYWDYYSYATLPAEFTNSSNNNPLYVDRLNTNVRQALTMAPFSPTLTNFPRGTSKAFEPSFEDAPHNPVHDIIGNIMSTMQSPIDPIFWLHHANVDRLWVAWVAGGGGRRMPAKSNSYWAGIHTYSGNFSMPRTATYDTRTNLQYYYQNETMPATLPLAQLSTVSALRVQALPTNLLKSIPPVGSFRVAGPRSTGTGRFSIGGALNIGLDERSISAQLPVNSDHWSAVQAISKGAAASVAGSPTKYKSVDLVLDGVELGEAGIKGGFYYQVYLNVPATEGTLSRPTSILLGTLGAFQINGATHHGHGPAQLRYSIARGVLPASILRVGMVSVSFVRIDGDKSSPGPAVGVAEARLELTTDDKGS
ncbi:MAG: tyrosinase family protein [Telluria sp.]